MLYVAGYELLCPGPRTSQLSAYNYLAATGPSIHHQLKGNKPSYEIRKDDVHFKEVLTWD